MNRPLTIVGGGLTGLSLGVALLRRGVPVSLHEAGSYPRHRVCGEFLNGVRDDVLETLGVRDLLANAIPQQSTAWFLGPKKVLSAPLPHPGRGLSRFALDNTLRRRFQDLGGELHAPSRLSPQAREGLVWCAGRNPARGPWIGLKCHLHHLPLEADLEMHLGRHGYAGLARVEDGRVNACGLFRLNKTLAGPDILNQYLRHCGLGTLAARLEGAERDHSSRAAVTGFHLGWQAPPKPDLLALGDACGMIPPFTGNGMSMAFESAHMALDPLTAYSRREQDWTPTRFTVQNHLRKKFAARIFRARVMHPFLTLPAGQAFFAAAVRSGLLPFHLFFHALR